MNLIEARAIICETEVRFKRVADGEYRGTIDGVPVFILRTVLGRHPLYHTYSRQPHWIAYHDVKGGKVLSDGNGTMQGAIDSAATAIRVRGLKETVLHEGDFTDMLRAQAYARKERRKKRKLREARATLSRWWPTGKTGTNRETGLNAFEEAGVDAEGRPTGERRWRLSDGRIVSE
jgi:hypothetical protein